MRANRNKNKKTRKIKTIHKEKNIKLSIMFYLQSLIRIHLKNI